MNFCDLRDRLVERIRRMTDNGAISESYLARRLGISQPHLHNTLKGVRSVTLHTADQFLDSLGLTALDLCDPADLQRALRECRMSGAGRASKPAPRSAKGRLLPVHSLTAHAGEPEWFQQLFAPKELLANLSCPELCVVDVKVDFGGLAAPGDILLLDRAVRQAPAKGAEDGAFVVAISKDGQKDGLALRWMARGARCLYCIERAEGRLGPASGRIAPLRWRPVLEGERVIARIHAISRQRSGTFQPPARPSGAN